MEYATLQWLLNDIETHRVTDKDRCNKTLVVIVELSINRSTVVAISSTMNTLMYTVRVADGQLHFPFVVFGCSFIAAFITSRRVCYL